MSLCKKVPKILAVVRYNIIRQSHDPYFSGDSSQLSANPSRAGFTCRVGVPDNMNDLPAESFRQVSWN